MAYCFFDTSALVPRYRPGPFTYRVNQVFGSPKEIFISEITMVEMVSTFCRICRTNGLSEISFDQMNDAFLQDVENERITIRPIGAIDLLNARHLLSLAGFVNRRNLGSSDALVAVSCRELALEKASRITFYTKDWPLYSILFQIGAYRAALKLKFLGPGRGGIPPSTR